MLVQKRMLQNCAFVKNDLITSNLERVATWQFRTRKSLNTENFF